MSVGKETPIAKEYVGHERFAIAGHRTVGRQNIVGRERSFLTGLPVIYMVGQQYPFPTDFVLLKVVFPTTWISGMQCHGVAKSRSTLLAS